MRQESYLEQYFEIPNDQKVMAALVEAVPSDWNWVSGFLSAPSVFYLEARRVVAGTGLLLGRFGSIKPTIVGEYDKHSHNRTRPDLVTLFVDNGLPGFIEIDEAGYDSHGVNDTKFETAQQITAGFVRKGYRGNLSFYSGSIDDNRYDNPARCNIALEPWSGAPFMREESGPQPARIKLEWQKFYNGNGAIAPLITACQSLKLQEYTPSGIVLR